MPSGSTGFDTGTAAQGRLSVGRTSALVLGILLYGLLGASIYREWWSAGGASPHDPARERSLAEARINFDHYTYLGLRYYGKRDFRRSEWAFRKSTECAPERALGFNNLGSALNAQGRWDDAIPVLEHALSLDPDLAIAKSNLAWAKTEQTKRSR